MAIVKVKKYETPFIQIRKSSAEASDMSLGATGLLTLLLARPTDWEINLTDLVNRKTDGRDAFRSKLNELRSLNYCHYFEIRKNGRVEDSTYLVLEEPIPYDTIKNTIEEYIEIEIGCTLYYKKPIEKCKNNSREDLKKESKMKEIKRVSSTRGTKFDETKNDSEKNIENIKKKPLPEKPIPAASVPVIPTLIIKDYNNIENNNNHDSDFDFNEFFKKLGIKFHKSNQESVKRLLKDMSVKQVVDYLNELNDSIKSSSSSVTNCDGLFTAKLQKGERQININQRTKILNEKVEKNSSKKLSTKSVIDFDAKEKQFEEIEVAKKAFDSLGVDDQNKILEMLKEDYLLTMPELKIKKIDLLAFVPFKLWFKSKLYNFLEIHNLIQ